MRKLRSYLIYHNCHSLINGLVLKSLFPRMIPASNWNYHTIATELLAMHVVLLSLSSFGLASKAHRS